MTLLSPLVLSLSLILGCCTRFAFSVQLRVATADKHGNPCRFDTNSPLLRLEAGPLVRLDTEGRPVRSSAAAAAAAASASADPSMPQLSLVPQVCALPSTRG